MLLRAPERRPVVERGYQRVLVPLLVAPESDRAMTVACRLAAERHATVTALAVVEVAPFLPFDAHMTDEEDDARVMLARAQAIGDAYGVTVKQRSIRARDASLAILEQLEADNPELVVIAARRREGARGTAPAFSGTVQQVLRKASSRVLVIAAPLR